MMVLRYAHSILTISLTITYCPPLPTMMIVRYETEFWPMLTNILVKTSSSLNLGLSYPTEMSNLCSILVVYNNKFISHPISSYMPTISTHVCFNFRALRLHNYKQSVTTKEDNMLVVHCVTVFLVTYVLRRSKSEQLVSYDEAVTKCASKGGLAPATWFSGVPHTVRYPDEARTDVKTYGDLDNLQLGEGESAWVGGYARYGQTLAWEGCWTSINNNRETMRLESKNSLYECSEKCLDGIYQYIGIKYQRCWCIQGAELSDTWQRSNCDDENSVGVYFVLKKTLNQTAQCIAAKMKYNLNEQIRGNIKSKPKDRVEKCTNKHSSVCTLITFKKEDQCTVLHDTKDNATYCLFDKHVTWAISYDTCVGMKGRLFPHDYGVFYYTDWFWMGQFRPFTIHETYDMSTSACLLVTRIGPDLFLEPDNCSIKLPLLCANDLSSHKKDTFDEVQNTNMIAGLVSLVCVFAIIGIGFIAHKRRTRKYKGLTIGYSQQETETFLTKNALVLDLSSNIDSDYNDPVDIYHTIDDGHVLQEQPKIGINQNNELDVGKTNQPTMDTARHEDTDDRLPADAVAIPQEAPQFSIYDVASNYPKNTPRNPNAPRNVYNHCVMVKDGSSNYYDVSANI